MRRHYATADVFTNRMFSGNPVAVVLDAPGLSSAQMQSVASEFNYSETTFVLPPKNPSHTARVRIFTPSREVPFAGHPNIGTAYVLAQRLAANGEPVPANFVFEEAAGLVPVKLLRKQGAVIGAELTAPEPLSRCGKVSAERVAICLGIAASDVRTEAHEPQVISVGLPFLVVELVSRDALRRLKPSTAAYDGVLPMDGANAIYAYTWDARSDEHTDDIDLQARMFMLRLTTEDPATGSATAAVTALLAELRDLDRISLRVSQGLDMGRPSLLLPRSEKRDGSFIAFVGGRCISVMEGSFTLRSEPSP